MDQKNPSGSTGGFMKDKKKMIVGIVLLLGAVYFLVNILTKEMESFHVTGLILFTILGLGFLRNARY
jgi:membrane-bound ClpP family serine protease